MSAKVLILDIERVPAWTKPLPVWDMKGLQHRYLSADDIDEWGRTICMAYRWMGKPIQFLAEWQEGGRGAFILAVRELLDEADIVVGHNSKGFDVPHLQGEILLEGYKAPSPVQHFDTLLTARKHFNFEANHLATLTQRLGITTKNDKYRIDVAMAAVAGDLKAQRRIERYNRGDVKATTELYLELRSYGSVNLGMYEDDPTRPVCPACGGRQLQRRGVAVKLTLRYPRFQCQGCGKWSTGKKALNESVAVRP